MGEYVEVAGMAAVTVGVFLLAGFAWALVLAGLFACAVGRNL